MFLQQNLKIRRCLACKKRKKKCQIEDSSEKCVYCSGKGIDCRFEDFEVSKYINGRIVKPSTLKKQANSKNKEKPSKTAKAITITPPDKDSLSSVGVPTIHIPVHSLDNSNGNLTLHQEIEHVKVLNDDTILDAPFSLFDFILSVTRVKLPDLGTCDVEKDRFHIATSNIIARKNEAIDTLKAYQKLLPSAATKGFTKKLLHAVSNSVNDVEFDVDISGLKNVMFITEAAVTTEVDGKTFVNLPDFISKELSDVLFGHFCDIVRETKSTSNSRISLLKIVLPLIFGNITVLKCALLLSYYHILGSETSPNFDQFQEKMYSLHVEILHELRTRLDYYTSVCCDHSLLIVYLLLTIEILNGARTTLWKKLLGLAQTMISLRGGVYELVESLTGLCLLKLMSIQICTEIYLESDGTPVSLPDLLHVLKTKTEFEFFDNFNYKYSLTLVELSPIIELYGSISIANRRMVVSFGSVSYDSIIDYNSVNIDIMNDAFESAADIAIRIDELESGIPDLNITEIHRAQLIFAIHASELFLDQTVYKQISICPKTVLKVKKLLWEVENIFRLLSSSSQEELRSTCILSLPLFCLGVDLLSPRVRDWYIDQLSGLLRKSKRKMIQTVIFLLHKVWELNKDGNLCVDWKTLSDIHCAYISLAC